MDAEEGHVVLAAEPWPALDWADWKETCATLHLWTQIVGKVLLAKRPFLNEWWQVALQLGPRGLTTNAVPSGNISFGMDFDFVDHQLVIATSRGDRRSVALRPRTVADFHREVMASLRDLGVDTRFSTLPVELPNPIPFERDTVHASYDPGPVRRWYTILLQTAAILERWRTPFVGKSSPVHFFWGSFDLNAARYSGRPAPPMEGPCFVRLAEDQENFACGFWPGNPSASGVTLGEPAFYAYMYPSPPGFETAQLRPEGARFNRELSQHILPYERVRRSDNPAEAIYAFFQSAWETSANLAGWDRAALERPPICR
ncbi:MAG: DUF5996 family protein [Pseudomonadota bacterium]|nr:DUF5996 family protein [Pseudomonadota bacterium]